MPQLPARTTLSRRSFLIGSTLTGLASPLLLSACAPSSNASGGGQMNWLTWSDHYANDQLQQVASATKILGKPKLFSDNIDAYNQLKQTGSQFDIVSGDALWVKKYDADGLIETFNLADITTSSELYSVARSFDFLNNSKGAIGYPFSWSTVQMYYNPKLVPNPPTSWADLADPRFKGLVTSENQPTDLMAIAAIATGSKSPYGMNDAEIAKAADYLKQLKPNFVKFATQNNEIITMLASGEAAIGISNLGADIRVKNAGGPQIEAIFPKDGTVGFIDSEMITAKGANEKLVRQFLSAMETAEYMIQNFTTNWRPVFNEKAAKALLADPKTTDAAKRLFMDKPEKALEMTLKGPAQNQDAYTQAFNQVFGA